MQKLVPIKLRNNKEILVLPAEVALLEQAGMLAKDFKPPEEAITKDASHELTPEQQKEANEKMKPTKRVRTNISKASFKK